MHVVLLLRAAARLLAGGVLDYKSISPNTRTTTRTTLQQYPRRSTWSCARASSTATRPFSTCKSLQMCARL